MRLGSSAWPSRALAVFLGAFAAAAQDPQADFAREALATLAAGEEELLRALAREFPHRARLLAHELVWEALRAGPGDERALDAARRIARALEQGPSDPADEALASEVRAVEGLGAEARALQRVLDQAFLAASQALAQGERELAEADARTAAEHAATLGRPYLELRARRLLAETLRGRAGESGLRAPMLRAVALERTLGLWTEAVSDLETLAQVELQEGRLHDAREHLEEAENLARGLGEPERAMHLSLQRGGVLANLGLFETAHGVLTTALAHFEAQGAVAEAARASTLLGELAGGAGRHEEALQRFADAGRATRAAGDGRGEVRALIQLAGVYSELGLVADAEDALERARVVLQDQALAPELQQWTLARGLVQLDAGRVEEALATLGAIEQPDVSVAHQVVSQDAVFAEAQRHAGTAHLMLHHSRQAEDAFRLALAYWSADPLKNTWARTGLGDALFLQGERAQAEREYAQALAEAERVASLEGSWRARLGLGRCAETEGSFERALAQYQLAIDEVEALRSLLAAPLLRSRWLGNKLELYHRCARLLARAGRLADAYRLAEAAKARTLLELSSERVARAAAQPAELAQDSATTARARTNAAESRLRLLELQLAALPSTPAAAATRADLAARLRDERAEHEAARLELQLADPRGATILGLADAPTLRETQQALRADERLLHYLVGSEGVSLFLVSAHGARFIELETSAAELEERIRRILDPIDLLREHRLDLGTLGFDARAALELERALLEPVRADLVGCRTMWVVPDGPLRRLPFALLVSAREKHPVDPARLFAQYAGCRFLIEDFAIGCLPSAGLLRTPAPATGAERELLVVADPSPMPDGASKLGWSLAEARAVAAGRGGSQVRVLTGQDAGEARVKAALPGARVAHFATHGLLDDRRPAFSRLALAREGDEDGWLHAHEVERLALSAERVVLSACETLGEAGRGEGLLGLARSFLQAGARSVVASAWAVDDRSTAELMRHYQERLARGEEPVAALRSAQLALLRGPGRPELLYLHPYFWGGFLHVGAR